MTWQPTTTSADTADTLVNGWVRVDTGGRSILLTPSAGTWFAFEDRCSHAGCAFSDDGELDGTTAICGCHGSEFDIRTGEVLRHPAERPIAVFPTRIVDGTVEVDVP